MKAAMIRLSHLWQDLNPVVVKELRQAVRSWYVSGGLLLFLLVLSIYILAFMANQSATIPVGGGFGAEVFQILITALSGACLLFIPAYTGTRLALERQDTNLDLLYVSTLSPGRIVRGKLFCGIYLAVLFFSACLPFIVLTNYMRGIDWLTIALTLAVLFAAVCLSVQLAIFAACLPVSLHFKAVLAIPLLIMMVMQTTGMTSFAMAVIRSGIWGGRMQWLNAAGIYLLLFGWLHLFSVALLSPRSMNRSLPLRMYSTLVWLAVGASTIFFTVRQGQGELMAIWILFSAIFIAVALVMSISQNDQLSLRVRNTIPREPASRIAVFPFFNGAAQGLVWTTLIALATAFGVYLVHGADRQWLGSTIAARHPMDAAVIWGALTFVLYCYCYCLTALFIHRNWISKYRSAVWAGLLAFIIPALLALLPNLALFALNRLSWHMIEQRQLGNVFNIMLSHDVGFVKSHTLFAAAWAILALLVNLPWFLNQVQSFRPPDRHSTLNAS